MAFLIHPRKTTPAAAGSAVCSRSPLGNILLMFCFLLAPLQAAGTKVLFDPSRPEIGPFPTDALTAPSTTTTTGRRVRLPAPPDCAATPSACNDAWRLEALDGFSPQGRVRVRFSGPVNPETLRDGIYLEPGTIRLNHLVWDPATNTAYGRPDAAVRQRSRYLVVVTDAVRDAAGDPVEPDEAFTACIAEAAPNDYCRELGTAVRAISGARVQAASLYTTMSVTHWLEKARDLLPNTLPAVRMTERGYLDTGELRSLVWRQQTRTSPPAFSELEFPLQLLTLLSTTVRGLAFGEFTSPSYLDAGRTIAAADSAADLPLPPATEQVPFHVYVPRIQKPTSGYPVVIYGHGFGDSRFGGPSVLALTLGEAGIATISINAVGHGFGPQSSVRIGTRSSGEFSLPAPGRGVDLTGEGAIDASEGCVVLFPAVYLRDCMRQTALDLMQLVRAIRSGIDVDGDGAPDLDASKIYYLGQSLGSMYGTLFLASEPFVQQATLNAGGGSLIDVARWSPGYRPLTTLVLGSRRPSLLNAGANFQDDYPLRNQPVRTVTMPGAIEIQNTLDLLEWLQAEGDPLFYAAYLKNAPLTGVPAKQILWQYPLGDASVPNPTQSALVRLAGMESTAWVYRHDLARARSPMLDANPHTYLTDILSFASLPIARAVQAQLATFFLNGQILDPSPQLEFLFGARLFQQPDPLPEDLNFVQP